MKRINKYLIKKEIKLPLNSTFQSNNMIKFPKFGLFDSVKEFLSNKLNKGLLIQSDKKLILEKKKQERQAQIQETPSQEILPKPVLTKIKSK